MAKQARRLDWYTANAAEPPSHRPLTSRIAKAIIHHGGRAWRGLPEPVRQSIWARTPRRLRGWLRRNVAVADRADWLNQRLWMGYSRRASLELRALADDAAEPIRMRVQALLFLAGRAAEAGDFAEALRLWQKMIALEGPGKLAHPLRYAHLLNVVGRGEEAAAWIAPGPAFAEVAVLSMANNAHEQARPGKGSPQQVLQHLNGIFTHHGVEPVGLKNPGDGLSLDNLATAAAPRSVEGPLVTVIVPAYNAADTIVTALESLARQTWDNLEVIVVDDASPDATAERAEVFAKDDSRFRVLRQETNAGAYAARNRALAEARGKYVTILDADDWAHPRRIELHARDLEDSDRIYNMSRWIRTTSDLFFPGSWKSWGFSFAFVNFGSLFFRRDIVDVVGTWGQARVSADREFLRRVERYAKIGRNQVHVAGGCPLTFGRVLGTSLTRASATQMNTMYHGVRREYHEATDYWHLQWANGRIDAGEAARRSAQAAPIMIRSKAPAASFDLVLIGDWNMRGGTFHSAANLANAAIRQGLRVGLAHYPSYATADRPIRAEVRDWIYGTGLDVVAPGEKVTAQTVVVTYPAIFNDLMDRVPTIDHRRLVVLVNQMAERDSGQSDVAYDVERVKAHLVEAFGTWGEWIPISNRVRGIMDADDRYPRPSAQTWTPLIDADDWLSRPAAWRGGERVRPHVGRHGRDHVLKWPAGKEAIAAAYCVDKPCDVYLLGGAEFALRQFMRHPSNWHVVPFGGADVKTFLSDLDIFLHYPHESYIEEFGRAPMEAMAIGVPVILPPVFRQTFGDAALYAEPAEVWATIERLWRDESAWMERVEAGRAYVRNNCSYALVGARLGLASSH